MQLIPTKDHVTYISASKGINYIQAKGLFCRIYSVQNRTFCQHRYVGREFDLSILLTDIATLVQLSSADQPSIETEAISQRSTISGKQPNVWRITKID